MNFDNLPKDYFLFGSFREPGKGMLESIRFYTWTNI
jgi:hypothetical protein